VLKPGEKMQLKVEFNGKEEEKYESCLAVACKYNKTEQTITLKATVAKFVYLLVFFCFDFFFFFLLLLKYIYLFKRTGCTCTTK
jgi:hypothetical protein